MLSKRVLFVLKTTVLASFIISMLILSACQKAYTPYDYFALICGEEEIGFDDEGELCLVRPSGWKFKLKCNEINLVKNDEINIVVDSITESGHLTYRMENISKYKKYIDQASLRGLSVLLDGDWYMLPISYSSTATLYVIYKDKPLYGGLSLNPEHNASIITYFPSGHYRVECKYEDELVIAEFDLVLKDGKYSLG